MKWGVVDWRVVSRCSTACLWIIATVWNEPPFLRPRPVLATSGASNSLLNTGSLLLTNSWKDICFTAPEVGS